MRGIPTKLNNCVVWLDQHWMNGNEHKGFKTWTPSSRRWILICCFSHSELLLEEIGELWQRRSKLIQFQGLSLSHDLVAVLQHEADSWQDPTMPSGISSWNYMAVVNMNIRVPVSTPGRYSHITAPSFQPPNMLSYNLHFHFMTLRSAASIRGSLMTALQSAVLPSERRVICRHTKAHHWW